MTLTSLSTPYFGGTVIANYSSMVSSSILLVENGGISLKLGI